MLISLIDSKMKMVRKLKRTCILSHTVEPFYTGHHWGLQTCPFIKGVPCSEVSFIQRCPLQGVPAPNFRDAQIL